MVIVCKRIRCAFVKIFVALIVFFGFCTSALALKLSQVLKEFTECRFTLQSHAGEGYDFELQYIKDQNLRTFIVNCEECFKSGKANCRIAALYWFNKFCLVKDEEGKGVEPKILTFTYVRDGKSCGHTAVAYRNKDKDFVADFSFHYTARMLKSSHKKFAEAFSIPCESYLKNFPDFLGIMEFKNIRDLYKADAHGLYSCVSDEYTLLLNNSKYFK